MSLAGAALSIAAERCFAAGPSGGGAQHDDGVRRLMTSLDQRRPFFIRLRIMRVQASPSREGRSST